MKSYKCSDKGKFRKKNEDYIFQSNAKINKLENLFIVCDGVGGNKAGDVASKKAVEIFIKSIKKSSNNNLDSQGEIKLLLSDALQKANEEIYKIGSSSSKYHNMCTTLISATIYKNKMYALSVGDSRIYMITIKKENDETKEVMERKSIVQITQDDAQIMEEIIRPKEINFGSAKETQTVRRRKVLTKAVGIMQNITGNYYEIDLNKKINDQNKIYFVMCSDGLYDGLNDEDILEIIDNNKSHNKAKELVKYSIKKGSKDNVSTIVVEL